MRSAALALVAASPLCHGHGQLTLPPSRNNGTFAGAGSCGKLECAWFSQPTFIPGTPTLNAPAQRTYNVDVSGGARDWSRRNPWRAPGTAPVYGSGCGSAGGGPVQIDGNGGIHSPGVAQGTDGAALPPVGRATWRRGETVEVAWAMWANHGGGYSYRLCGGGANASEECFQRTVLRFAGGSQWLQYPNVTQYGDQTTAGRRYEIPLVRVTEGTHPEGSEWARNPVPGCLLCDQADCAAPFPDNTPCAAKCSGGDLDVCPPGMAQFPEPLPGLSGFTPKNRNPEGGETAAFQSMSVFTSVNIVDRVLVPAGLAQGEYLLSWRWDTEQSPQVWQNCADVRIV